MLLFDDQHHIHFGNILDLCSAKSIAARRSMCIAMMMRTIGNFCVCILFWSAETFTEKTNTWSAAAHRSHQKSVCRCFQVHLFLPDNHTIVIIRKIVFLCVVFDDHLVDFIQYIFRETFSEFDKERWHKRNLICISASFFLIFCLFPYTSIIPYFLVFFNALPLFCGVRRDYLPNQSPHTYWKPTWTFWRFQQLSILPQNWMVGQRHKERSDSICFCHR